ncbi:hypothetical protein [Salicola sp. Rm-C-2C1-2]|uniref:hypothetical protein n=1 Tax=Salicola sp. Rm-C-2C1-2 TaxID=3141321 RepID=UPI0032E3DAA9
MAEQRQPLRDAVTPGSIAERTALEDFRELSRCWQSQRVRESVGCEWDALIALVCALGLGLEQAVASLAALCQWHWNRQTGRLRLPASPMDAIANTAEAAHEVALPQFTHAPLNRFLRVRGNDAAALDRDEDDASAWQKRQQARDQMMATVCQQCERFVVHNDLLPTLSLKSFSRAWLRRTLDGAALALIQRGMPSIWVSMMRGAPLPTTTPSPVFEDEARLGQGSSLDLASVATRSRRGAGNETAVSLTMTPDKEYCERSPWLVEAIRQRMSALLKKIEPMMNKHSQKLMARKESTVQRLCEDTLKQLKDIEQADNTLAQLTVLCLAAALDQRESTFSTLCTYMDHLRLGELLSAPLSLNVAEWDGDAVGDIAELIDASRNWASATWTVFWAALGWFVRYVQSLGYAEEVAVPGGNQGPRASIHRNNLLRPPAVDALVRDCLVFDEAGSEGTDVGLLIALAYYCGLRSGELVQLTLADIVVDESDEPVAFSSEQLRRLLGSANLAVACPDSFKADNVDSRTVYINVLYGKTAAARRCIPVHALAPSWIVSALIDYWREHSQRTRRLDKFPLFAPHRYVAGYKRDLTRLAIEALQRRYGNGRDLHLLRHCAASNLALRIHGLDHPEFRQQLAEREHELFSDTHQARLQTEMENPLGDTLWGDGLPYHWMSRVLGHSNAETSFRVYVHTAGVIHSDLLWRVFSNHAKRSGGSVP